MKLVSCLIAGLFLLMPSFALAALDGNELLKKCGPIEKLYDNPASLSSQEASDAVYCLGYMDSFLETFYFQYKARIVPAIPYCLPDEKVPRRDIVNVVVKYLEKHPEELQKPAGLHIIMALRETFPCNKEADGKKPEAEVKNKQSGDAAAAGK